jgi:hypothetical protein
MLSERKPVPSLFVAKDGVPANDLKSFIAWLKPNPGKTSWGTQETATSTM